MSAKVLTAAAAKEAKIELIENARALQTRFGVEAKTFAYPFGVHDARIEAAVSAPYQVGPDVVRVGASVGIAYGRPGEPVTDIIGRADAAMYAVKRARRGTGAS